MLLTWRQGANGGEDHSVRTPSQEQDTEHSPIVSKTMLLADSSADSLALALDLNVRLFAKK